MHGAAVVRESVQVAMYLENDHEDAAARYLQAAVPLFDPTPTRSFRGKLNG